MTYVDGFVIPVPKNKVDDYRKFARKAGKVWMEHGALEYIECVGENLRVKDMEGNWATPFPEMTKLKPNETVLFSWIVYRSRAHRDRVNKKAMSDPRLTGIDPETMPVDMKRVAYGGFRPIVEMHSEE